MAGEALWTSAGSVVLFCGGPGDPSGGMIEELGSGVVSVEMLTSTNPRTANVTQCRVAADVW